MTKIGVTLSGGFLKGIAHAGLLKALEQKGMAPSFVAGASSGSVIGFLYCAGISPDRILELAKSLSWLSLTSISFKGGIALLSGLKEKLLKLVGDIRFEDLKVPFGLSVVNLKTIKTELITSGKAVDFVVASCSIPPLFSPWKIGENYYVDGGIRNCLPAEIPKAFGCGINVCSDVNTMPEDFNPYSLKQVSERVSLASTMENEERRYPYCDIIVKHKCKGSHLDFGMVESFFDVGYKNGLKVAGRIEEML